MCSTGWLKLKGSWILFKNRDRDPKETKKNFLVQDKSIVGFADKSFEGLWVGLNRYGIGITTAYGPIKKAEPGLEPENFWLNEKVLRKCKTVEEAKNMYLRLAKRLGRSYNVIIADSTHATSLEIAPGAISKNDHDKMAIKTNCFTELKEFNAKGERVKRSELRLKKIAGFIKNIKSGKDIIPLLKFHSKENEYENICRHDYSVTVASAIFEVFANRVNVYYLLNKSPHEGNFKVKKISMRTSA